MRFGRGGASTAYQGAPGGARESVERIEPGIPQFVILGNLGRGMLPLECVWVRGNSMAERGHMKHFTTHTSACTVSVLLT